MYELSENEKELIKKIKTSDRKVSVCSGCVYFDNVSLKEMFSEDNFLGSNRWIEKLLKPSDKTLRIDCKMNSDANVLRFRHRLCLNITSQAEGSWR